MPNDMYEQYRKPLTQEELEGMPEAEEKSRLMAADAARPDGRLQRVANGYVQKADGVFLPDPVTTEYMSIAMERADAQFEGWPVMPEDTTVMAHYPGIDPVGKYSAIDMEMAQRVAKINASLEGRSPEVNAYAASLLAMISENSVMRDINLNTTLCAQKHRTISRAAKLCPDETGRNLLHQETRILESSHSVMEMNIFLQGVEYAAGVKTGPVPQEVQDFYAKRLKTPLDLNRIKEAEQLDQTPREVKAEFHNLDNKVMQEVFSNPKHWGKKPHEITNDDITMEHGEQSIAPYARATVARVLQPLFNNVERMTGDPIINRADHIIVGGKTVREKMFEDFLATGGKPNEFIKFFDKNSNQMTNDYVAGALMAGERVEAFIPDKNGRIPNEPVRITKKGYEPSPLNPVTLNAWERFWSKRGFYKDKAKAAVEYQNTLEARERVKVANIEARSKLDHVLTPFTKNQYFSDWIKKNGPLPTSVPNRYSVTRSALTSVTMCHMVAQGYPVEDVFDPNKLRAEKQKFGGEVVDRMKAGDQTWMGDVLFHGQRILCDYVDDKCKTVNVFDAKQLVQPKCQPLLTAIDVIFDASQESSHCMKEYKAAAERYAPGNGAKVMQQVDDRACSSSTFLEASRKYLQAQSKLAAGIVPPSQASQVLHDIVNYAASRSAYTKSVAANPQKPFTQHFTLNEMFNYGNFSNNVDGQKPFTKLSNQLMNPNAQRDFARALASGQALNRMHFTFGQNEKENSFKIDAPSMQERAMQSTNRDMREIAQRTASKPMGGGRAK